MTYTGQAFVLPSDERHSALWKRLEQFTDERLNVLRRRNDGELTPDQTAHLRGRIAEIKHIRDLLAMENPSPAKVADSASPLP